MAAVAAGIALIISVTFFFDTNETPKSGVADVDWNSVSRDEVLAYIDENIDDFETEALAQHLTSIPDWTATTDNVGTTTPAEVAKTGKEDKYDALFKDVDKQDILEYLEEEAIELDELSPL